MGWLWKHCEECDAEMGQPTQVDAIVGHTRCDACGHETRLDPDERRWKVEELLSSLVRRPPDPPS